jgi:hypothetical protein
MYLVGSWTIDLLSSSAEAFGDVSMEFADDGTLIYTVHRPAADSLRVLEWRVDGGELVTAEASSAGEQRTPARLDEAGRLILGSPGDESVFIRLPVDPNDDQA